jgi:thiosulfate dehydrogenase (quinone) large subunit
METKQPTNWIFVLRIFMGIELVRAGADKIIGGKFPYMLDKVLTGFATNNPVEWYSSFLHAFAIPHHVAFGYMVEFGELLIGLALVSGLLATVASAFGVFMSLNLYLGTLAGPASAAPMLNLMFVFAYITFVLCHAGRYLGLDAFLHKRYPKVILW